MALLVGVSGLAISIAAPARAADATWTVAGLGNWNNGLSWSTGIAPTGTDTATFDTVGAPAVGFTLGTSSTIGGISFTGTAPIYTFAVTGAPLLNTSLTLTGAGIQNSSTLTTPIFNVGGTVGNTGTLAFNGAGTSAGNAIVNAGLGGIVNFAATSTAANSTITATLGGAVNFAGNSVGGNAQISVGGAGSTLNFSGSSSAGNAGITVNLGGAANFTGNATGGTAALSNPNDLIIGANIVGAKNIVAGSPFTARVLTGTNSNMVEDRLVNVGGSYSAWTPLLSAAPWVMQMVAFKAAPSGPPPQPPTAPTNLAATAASSTRVDLSWTNTSTLQTGVKIERSTDSATFTQIALAGANAVSYSDVGLSASTTYFYRVRATNNSGDSPYSNTASATTQSPPPNGQWSAVPFVAAGGGPHDPSSYRQGPGLGRSHRQRRCGRLRPSDQHPHHSAVLHRRSLLLRPRAAPRRARVRRRRPHRYPARRHPQFDLLRSVHAELELGPFHVGGPLVSQRHLAA